MDPTLWEFEYRNWRGIVYTYLVDIESELEFCEIGNTGIWKWVVHGNVIQRNGAPRSDGQVRRTFVLEIIKNLREIEVP